MAKLSGYMVPELRREREASALNLAELTEFIDGGEMITEKRKRICESPFHVLKKYREYPFTFIICDKYYLFRSASR